ncbi:hypothetical protein [Kitasatospora sp. NPDC088346]|uniref:hypothetical protein n=1 Tax=Kitasatospora sp. NPDC088346 TaxID=3364073 RepID=UPI00382EA95C
MLIVVLFVALGYLLGLPVLVPDLMAAQDPPQHANLPQLGVLVALAYGTALVLAWTAGRGGRRGPWWAVPLRAAVLTGLASLLAVLVREFLAPKVFGPEPGWVPTADLQCLVVGVAARVWFKVVRGRARRAPHRPPATAGGATPAPGEVWLALVPYRERDERSRHYCVIVNAHADHAEVLQITTKDKDDRPDHIRMGTDGWNRSGKPC